MQTQFTKLEYTQNCRLVKFYHFSYGWIFRCRLRRVALVVNITTLFSNPLLSELCVFWLFSPPGHFPSEASCPSGYLASRHFACHWGHFALHCSLLFWAFCLSRQLSLGGDFTLVRILPLGPFWLCPFGCIGQGAILIFGQFLIYLNDNEKG